MKALNQTERTLAYKIECARFSFRILETRWQSLRSMLRLDHEGNISDEAAIEIFSSAWQVVDFAFRHINVVRTIPGFPRKDDRFRAFLKLENSLKNVRNHIQHVDHETHKHNNAETYPILGALAW